MNYSTVTLLVFLIGVQVATCLNVEVFKKHCTSFAEETWELEKAINVTYRFLRTPSEYIGVTGACEKANECMNQVEQTKNEMDGMCSFYAFYSQEFAPCATKLIAKKDANIHCLDILFNDYDEPEVDECDQWDSLQPCIKTQIESVCGQKPDAWVKYAARFRKSMCETTKE